MAFSALASLINARNLSGSELVAHFSEAFSTDSMHFVNANNSQPIDAAVNALPMGKAQVKGAQNKAIGDAIAHAVKALRSSLPDGNGWIGAVHGAFSKASKEIRLPYLEAHAVGVDAFRASLVASGAFPEKVNKTEEEKAQAKKEKEEKAAKAAQEASDAARAAIIASGEFVAKVDVLTIDDMATSALIDALISRQYTTISKESADMLDSFTHGLMAYREKLAALQPA